MKTNYTRVDLTRRYGQMMLALAGIVAPAALASVPVTGRYVSQFQWIDTAVRTFMDDNDISGGLVAIMKDDKIIYQRGFGWKDQAGNVDMPENTLVRVASCTKPITAAAVRQLVSVSDKVFNFGDGGILSHAPFPGMDERLADITVQHCLDHEAGWERDSTRCSIAASYSQMPCDIAAAMGYDSPPGVGAAMTYLLHQDLCYDPGATYAYSNDGYMVLGHVVEFESGMDILSYHRANVLTQDMWVPATDLLLGETFAENQPYREAWYDSRGSEGVCVFPREVTIFGFTFTLPACDESNVVDLAYGSWDHESYRGFGGVVASPGTMLEVANQYYLDPPNIGKPLPGPLSADHGGSFSGTNTLLVQRSIDSQRVNVFIFFNKNPPSDDPLYGHYANDFYNQFLNNSALPEYLGNQNLRGWPTTDIGGFWVDPEQWTWTQYGCYDIPFGNVDNALLFLADGSRVNFHPGTSSWTGTISTKLLLNAPLGAIVIGASP